MKYIHPSVYFKWICGHTGSLGIRMWFTYGYKSLRGTFPNISKPSNLSEYIISKLLDSEWDKKISVYADKCAVRNYIAAKGYAYTLLECYGEWSSFDEIDFDSLPNTFVLKANNGCGNHVFCTDKKKLDKITIKPIVEKNMAINDIMFKFEPHYSFIQPKVYAEELMDLESVHGIIDYKFFCVHGEIYGIQVIGNRHGGNYDMDLRDSNWIKMQGLTISSDKDIFSKPQNFEKMKEIAKSLSSDFNFVRVDLYEYKGDVKFGELTFTPGGALLSSFSKSFLEGVYNKMKSN